MTMQWAHLGRLMPATPCVKGTAQGAEEKLPAESCEFRVRAERLPSEDELTFVRLFPDPEEKPGNPERVVVKRDSKVEFLAARALLVWTEEKEVVNPLVAEDVWLKVRIDGREGWIHTEEDLAAIGLPAAG